jgi:hypothetical protein
MGCGFRVYIDESGDEGFKFGSEGQGGSSEWFVLSAVVIRACNDRAMMDMVAKVRAKLNKKPNFPLHFRDLRHEPRVAYVMDIAAAPVRTLSVLIHKPSLKEPETFRDSYRLYFYAARYLLERVSWLCRDAHKKNAAEDGSAQITFSNRSSMSYSQLREYVDKLLNNADALGVRIDASVIKPDQIDSRLHQQLAGLQVADAVASSFYFAVQTHRLGFTEPHYVQRLSPVVYRHEKQAIGYGIKFWPREATDLIKQKDTLKWVSSLFA